MVQPLKDLGPELDLIAPITYTGFQAMLDASAPPTLRSNLFRLNHHIESSEEAEEPALT